MPHNCSGKRPANVQGQITSKRTKMISFDDIHKHSGPPECQSIPDRAPQTLPNSEVNPDVLVSHKASVGPLRFWISHCEGGVGSVSHMVRSNFLVFHGKQAYILCALVGYLS